MEASSKSATGLRRHAGGVAPNTPAPRGTRYAVDARGWLLAADLCAIAAGILIAIGMRRIVGAHGIAFEAIVSHRVLFLTFGLLVVIRLGLSGAYDARRRFARIDDAVTLLRAAFVGAALAVFVALLTKGFFTGFTDYSRVYLALGMGTPIAMLAGTRIVGHALQGREFRSGSYLSRALIIGDGLRAAEFAHWVESSHYLGVSVRRSEAPLDEGAELYERAFARELDDYRPDEIVLAFDTPRGELQLAAVREAAVRGVSVKVLPGVFESYHASFFEYGGVPVTTVFNTSGERFARTLRAAGDRMLALGAIVAALPVLAMAAIAIRVLDPGPVLYCQPRVGLHGRRFSMLKLRTMRMDADERLAALLVSDAAARDEWDCYQKISNDPRITRVGAFLRRWSIDELPQLFNVLIGDMSLVGPRPPMLDQRDFYGVRFVFSQVKPGITGLWQVSGRNELSFDERIDLDTWYVENWSLRLDVHILLKTVTTVLGRRGAA